MRHIVLIIPISPHRQSRLKQTPRHSRYRLLWHHNAMPHAHYSPAFLSGFFLRISTICRPLSCPTLSPEPSSLRHPEPVEASVCGVLGGTSALNRTVQFKSDEFRTSSQASRSSAVMLTSSLNSLRGMLVGYGF